MEIRWSRVSSRNALARPARASADSTSEVPPATSGRVSITVTSSRSTVIDDGSVCHSSGSRPENQPRTRSIASSVIM